MPTKIPATDVSVRGDSTIVSGRGAEALATALIRKSSSTIGELASAYTYVDPEDISVDSTGRVVIKNARFAEAVSAKKSGGGDDPGFFDTNCNCRPPS